VIRASEAVLAGEYLEHLRLYRRPVPVWVWTNVLAHGTEGQIQHASRVRSSHLAAGIDQLKYWTAARSLAADATMAVARRRGSLSDLQTDVLIPLELRLLDPLVTAKWTPDRWLEEVIASIDPHRRAPFLDAGLG